MSHKYKTVEGKLYYVTLTVVGWIDVFTRRDYVEEIIKNLKYCQENKGLEIFAYVIMTNHMHLVCRTNQGTINEVFRDFKSYTAKKLIKMISENQQESRQEWMMHMFRYFGRGNSQNKEFQFWRNGNHAIELWSENMILQKINYIHMNPVKARIVGEPQHYLHSSANEFSEIKVPEM
jgi:putative transposase